MWAGLRASRLDRFDTFAQFVPVCVYTRTPDHGPCHYFQFRYCGTLFMQQAQYNILQTFRNDNLVSLDNSAIIDRELKTTCPKRLQFLRHFFFFGQPCKIMFLITLNWCSPVTSCSKSLAVIGIALTVEKNKQRLLCYP